jgi:uncharacterized heparinase superfamily protein
MHPYFAQELARERRAEQLGTPQFRPTKRATAAAPAARASPTTRARHSLGRALVALGTRLLGGGPAPLEPFLTRR